MDYLKELQKKIAHTEIRFDKGIKRNELTQDEFIVALTYIKIFLYIDLSQLQILALSSELALDFGFLKSHGDILIVAIPLNKINDKINYLRL